MRLNIAQTTIPQIVGMRKASAVQNKLPDSFFIVRSVVEHGQWRIEKSIKDIAVEIVQPF